MADQYNKASANPQTIDNNRDILCFKRVTRHRQIRMVVFQTPRKETKNSLIEVTHGPFPVVNRLFAVVKWLARPV